MSSEKKDSCVFDPCASCAGKYGIEDNRCLFSLDLDLEKVALEGCSHYQCKLGWEFFLLPLLSGEQGKVVILGTGFFSSIRRRMEALSHRSKFNPPLRNNYIREILKAPRVEISLIETLSSFLEETMNLVEQLREYKISNEKISEKIKTMELERNCLIQELQHRMRNTLQLISSFIRLQESSIEKEEVKEAFQGLSSRLLILEMAEKNFTAFKHPGYLDSASFFKDILFNHYFSRGLSDRELRLVLDLSDMILPVNKAIPLGMILHEILECLMGELQDKKGHCLYLSSFNFKEENILSLSMESSGEKLDLDKALSSCFRVIIDHFSYQNSLRVEKSEQGSKVCIYFK